MISRWKLAKNTDFEFSMQMLSMVRFFFCLCANVFCAAARVTIDGFAMKVIAADGFNVVGHEVDSIELDIAQVTHCVHLSYLTITYSVTMLLFQSQTVLHNSPTSSMSMHLHLPLIPLFSTLDMLSSGWMPQHLTQLQLPLLEALCMN
jgi:hypothetical protein